MHAHHFPLIYVKLVIDIELEKHSKTDYSVGHGYAIPMTYSLHHTRYGEIDQRDGEIEIER